MSPNCNFPHRCLMPNCNGDYWPKSSTRLFMLDNLHQRPLNYHNVPWIKHLTLTTTCGIFRLVSQGFLLMSMIILHAYICMHGSLGFIIPHVKIVSRDWLPDSYQTIMSTERPLWPMARLACTCILLVGGRHCLSRHHCTCKLQINNNHGATAQLGILD